MELKGVLAFYVSVVENSVIDYNEIIKMAKEAHTDVISSMKEEGWEIMFIPCVGEASHTSKVELDGTGCIIAYININAEANSVGINVSKLIDSAKENHIEMAHRFKENGWNLIFMPCVGEGGRIEKINLKEEKEEDNDD